MQKSQYSISAWSGRTIRWISRDRLFEGVRVALTTLLVSAVTANGLRAEQLDEIVVTAQKRTQSVEDIAASVSVVGSKDMTDLRIKQPVDLANIVPGLSTFNATSGGTPLFAVRGIGMDDYNPNNTSGVATYLDDVYASFPVFLAGQIFDVERIEVLEGPQGTLYGKTATGGAINIISRKPSEDTNGYFDVSYGRWNAMDLQAAIGGRLTEMLTGRIAETYSVQGEGYQTDIDSGFREGKPNRGAIRGELEFKPNSRFTVLLNVHGAQDRSIPPSPQSYNNEQYLPSPAKGIIDTPSTDASVVRVGDLSPRLDNHSFGASLAISYDSDAVSFVSTTGYDQASFHTTDNLDGTAGPTADLYQSDRMSQYYEEVRASSKAGLFSGLIDWVVGGSLGRDVIDGQDRTDQSAVFVGQYLDPPDFEIKELSIAAADYVQTRTSTGAFLHTETHVTDTLGFIVGARYSHDRLSFDGVSTEDGSADGGVLFHGIGSVVAALDQVHNEENFSYQAGVKYKVASNDLIYATVSTAYKPGAFYASPALDPADWGYVAPEHVFAIEIGDKLTALNGALRLDGAYFHYNYTNRQSLADFVSPITHVLDVSLANVPKSAVDGVELNGRAKIAGGLEISGSVTYLDARVTQPLLDVRGAPLLLDVPAGTALAMSPKWTLQARPSYNWSLTEEFNAALEINASWRSGATTQLSDPNAISGIQKLLGATLTILQSQKGYSVSLWGKNLTNSNFSTNQFSSYYGGVVMYREMPRTYGVDLRWEF